MSQPTFRYFGKLLTLNSFIRRGKWSDAYKAADSLENQMRNDAHADAVIERHRQRQAETGLVPPEPPSAA